MKKSLCAALSACVLLSSPGWAAAPCNTGDPTGTYIEYDAIQYGANAGDLLNLFVPTPTRLARLGLSSAAAILVIHGHGSHYNDLGWTSTCGKFASNGIACASIEYPEVDGSAAWQGYAAVNCALRWMRVHGSTYNWYQPKIGVLGGSLGGRQAMWEAATQDMTETPRLHFPLTEPKCPDAGARAGVEAVVLQYGQSDLTIPVNLGGAPPAQTQAVAAGTAAGVDPLVELSPITYLTKAIPTLISVGNWDTTVNPVNTGMWVKALLATGAKMTYVDPTSHSDCTVGAICGGAFAGDMQYWELGGFAHGYQVFTTGPNGPYNLVMPPAYTCSVIAFYWRALLGLPASGAAQTASR